LGRKGSWGGGGGVLNELAFRKGLKRFGKTAVIARQFLSQGEGGFEGERKAFIGTRLTESKTKHRGGKDLNSSVDCSLKKNSLQESGEAGEGGGKGPIGYDDDANVGGILKSAPNHI